LGHLNAILLIEMRRSCLKLARYARVSEPLKSTKFFSCQSEEIEDGDSEVVEVIATKNNYQLPRTQSRYMAVRVIFLSVGASNCIMIHAFQEVGNEAEPLTEGSLDAPSTPIPDFSDQGLTMDTLNESNQQSIDDVSRITVLTQDSTFLPLVYEP
jgi:hypothetical protein